VEVAKLAGVSVTTVSRCLNSPEKVGKKTLARVRRVIEEINFSPNMLAQNFRRGKTNIILVVVHEIGSWLFLLFLCSTEDGNPTINIHGIRIGPG
jgi:LacI family repressor for deo operon, udp, cdd, tsx, nupC, and nupG